LSFWLCELWMVIKTKGALLMEKKKVGGPGGGAGGRCCSAGRRASRARSGKASEGVGVADRAMSARIWRVELTPASFEAVELNCEYDCRAGARRACPGDPQSTEIALRLRRCEAV